MKRFFCNLSALLLALSLIPCAWGCSGGTTEGAQEEPATEGLSFYPVETESAEGGPLPGIRVLSWGVRHPLYQMFITNEEVETDLHTKHVVIPATHLGAPVVEIGEFNGSRDYIENQIVQLTQNQSPAIVDALLEAWTPALEKSHIAEIESVSIPDTVMRISDKAFEGTALYQNEENWVDGCLYSGKHLLHIGPDVPEKLTVRKGTISVFSDRGTDGGGEPKEVVLPDGVKTIGAGFALYGLKKIEIPKSVTKIEETAFADNRALEEIVVSPQNPVFRSAGNCLLEGSTLIRANKNWTIPANAGIDRIDMEDWRTNYGVDRIVIPEGVKEIVGCSFSSCSAEFVFPESLEKIGVPKTRPDHSKYPFNNCSDLTGLVLPEGVKEINWAFNSCPNLRYAVIGRGIESMEASFYGPAFEEIFYRGTEEEWSKVRLEGMDYISVYFYSETGGENTWHFDGDVPVIWNS